MQAGVVSEGLPAVVVVTDSLKILPFVKVFPIQASFATEWFRKVSGVAASFPHPTRFCCYTDRVSLNTALVSMWGKKNNWIFVFNLHFPVFEGFGMCFIHFLENAWDEHRQTSVMAHVLHTWECFLLFLPTKILPNAAKTTSMTNSFIFTSWFCFSLLKYFCLMME